MPEKSQDNILPNGMRTMWPEAVFTLLQESSFGQPMRSKAGILNARTAIRVAIIRAHNTTLTFFLAFILS